MNEIKFDIDNKLDGAKTYRGQNPKFISTTKQFNFPNSPRNKNIKYLNLGNINTNQISKYISKANSPNQILSENIKKTFRQSIKNQINQSRNQDNAKLIKKKKINNNDDYRKIKESNYERLFQKGVLNEKLESYLFKSKLRSKNNNKLLNSNNNILNNIDSTSRLKLNENKKDLTSFIELKYQPFSKINNKRSSSVLNGNKINESIKENNFIKKDSLLLTKYKDNEKIKIIKTPNNKNIIESDRDKSIYDFNRKILNKRITLELEENHFKAVLYTQEIKKLKKNLD